MKSAGALTMIVGSSLVMAGTPIEAGAGKRPPSIPAAATLCGTLADTLFSCPIGRRTVSICRAGSSAEYRFGTRGHVELASTDLAYAETDFAGGGESQVSFSHDGYRYVLYDRTVRTGFAADGRHDAAEGTGLLVTARGRTVSNHTCGAAARGDVSAASHLLRRGRPVEH